ncbi:MAG: NAD(+)/NADH kinase [Christensenella sp.]|nr:NAD(+)/NADH kinase [Christensenella sp.]
MKIGFAGNLEKEGIAEFRLRLMEQAAALGEGVVALDCVEAVRAEEPAPNLLVVIGGDGTLLRFASVSAERDLPMLGVNLGRIGFLSEIALNEFSDAVEKIQQGQFRIEERMTLQCSVNGEPYASCLNDILISKQSFSGTIQVDLFCDGQAVGSVFSDGIIASTPTGSTAYNLSAGGPVVTQNLDSIVITAVCSHTLHIRPIVSAPDTIWTFHVNGDGFVAGDGIKLRRVSADDRIIVTRSDRRVKFIRFRDQNVFELIRQKLT